MVFISTISSKPAPSMKICMPPAIEAKSSLPFKVSFLYLTPCKKSTGSSSSTIKIWLVRDSNKMTKKILVYNLQLDLPNAFVSVAMRATKQRQELVVSFLILRGFSVRFRIRKRSLFYLLLKFHSDRHLQSLQT